MGRVVGVAALAAAVVVPSLVPHFPTTFLADGLGRSADGAGRHRLQRAAGLEPSTSRGTSAAGRATRCCATAAPRTGWSRCGSASSTATGGVSGRPAPDFTFVPVDGRIPGPMAGPEVPRRVEQITVHGERHRMPQVALPGGHDREPVPGRHLEHDRRGARAGDRSPSLATRPSSSSWTRTPRSSHRPTPTAGERTRRTSRSTGARRTEVRALLAELTDDGDSAARRRARDPGATCADRSSPTRVELADETADGSLPEEPLGRFLETKRGYCVQFSSAMIMLSRAAGIPARMASASCRACRTATTGWCGSATPTRGPSCGSPSSAGCASSPRRAPAAESPRTTAWCPPTRVRRLGRGAERHVVVLLLHPVDGPRA